MTSALILPEQGYRKVPRACSTLAPPPLGIDMEAPFQPLAS